MAPLMPVGVFNGASAAGLVVLVIGVVVAVVCVVILVRLYRPKHLDERTGVDGGTAAGGSTAGFWGVRARGLWWRLRRWRRWWPVLTARRPGRSY